jgi:hypothetical protein
MAKKWKSDKWRTYKNKALNERIHAVEVQYQSLCVITTMRDANLTEILTQVRAVKGVVTVTTVEPHALRSETQRSSIIKVKYIPVKGYSLRAYQDHFKERVSSIIGVESFDIRKTKQIDSY